MGNLQQETGPFFHESIASPGAEEKESQEWSLFPLSFAQQRLWFLEQWEPGNPLYMIPTVLRLNGKLDVGALQRSVNEVVQRHESLRTLFVNVDSQLFQRIIPPASLPWELQIRDLQTGDIQEQEQKVRQLIAAEIHQPFNLSRGPLLRTTLLRLGEHQHLLLLTLHHIIADGWSVGIIFRELAAFYETSASHAPLSLAELPFQYADFAVWQQEWLQGQALESLLAYWRQQLSDLPDTLALPTDYPREEAHTSQGALFTSLLPQSLSLALQQLAQQENATLFMLLIAAFKSLLYHYTGQEDLVIGTPVANRNRADIEGLVGYFINTLVLRSDLSGNPTFREIVQRVRNVCLDAYAHQDLPFEKLTENVYVDRHLGHNPIVQILLTMQNVSIQPLELTDLAISPVEIQFEVGVTTFDIALDFIQLPEGIKIIIEYNKGLYDVATMSRMAGHYRVLLASVVANPNLALQRFPLLTETERDQLLVQWNAGPVLSLQEKCTHHLFEMQAARTPEAIAIVCGQENVTYQQLNQRANQLAHYLGRFHIKPDDLVGVYLDRSVEAIVSILGILKAGGAYVALDRYLPQERLSFLLEDAHISVLVTQQSFKALLPARNMRIVVVDQEWADIAQCDTRNPANRVNMRNLAYAIYTSGSTGQPRGVLIQHHSLAHYCEAFAERYALHRSDRVLQIASLSFDVAVEEIFPTIISGATLVMWPEVFYPSPGDFHRFLKQELLTIIDIPVAYWHEWVIDLASNKETLSASLRLVIVGGERTVPQWLGPWKALAGDRVRWANAYGPTETTITSLVYEVDVTTFDGAPGVVPIGRPIAGTQAYILDGQMSPVPIGVAGDLYLAGVSLARGYLNRPDLTAERFVPHCFATEPGTRLYRTGDRARYLPGGNIDFLGRDDQQIKVRGFRIEPGEIECKLRHHPMVQDVLVHVSEDTAGDKQIIAYIISHPGETLTRTALHTFVKNSLPEYMIPAAFVFLATFPYTRNNKIDYRKLPMPMPEKSDEETENGVGPKNPIEELLVDIWADVLAQEDIGVYDNFFALGGHSLKGVRVISRVRNAFQLELPLRILFDEPTVKGLARYIESQQQKSARQLDHAIVPVSREKNLPLSFAQERLWFLSQLTEHDASYNLPVVLRFVGQLHFAALKQSIYELIRRHEVLRSSILAVERQLLQRITPFSQVALDLPLIDLSAWPEAQRAVEVKRLMREEIERPFALTRGSLMRTRLLQLSETESLLLLTQHHIVCDDWSLHILFHELGVFYQAFASQSVPVLPPLPIQYADFASWQREWLRGEILEEQLSYWKHQLNQASLVLELPLDKPRPAVPTFRGALQTLELSPELSQALKRLSRQEDATLFMTLLAAFYVLLSRYTGQDDILIGSPIANRTRTETEHLAGCFLNTLVLRARLTCEMTFRELLLQVRRVALEAYAHQELPVEKLIEELHPERDLHRNPLFQVLFTFLDASPRPFTLPDMTIELCDAENHRAKLDLSLTAVERNSQLVLSFEYNTDLFYNATVVRMLEHFQVLLKEIVAEPEKRLSALTLMSTHELIALLTRWNTTRKPLRNVGFSALFEAQAEQTPDAIAIVCGDEQLTYAELKQRANQLAHHLSKQGVGTDICVALLLDRSIHFSMGILAIFKAGGAFLPLDPLHPIQRHLQVVEQSHCRFLLTQKKHGQRFTTAWQKPGTDQSQSLSILDIEVLLQASAPQQSIALPDTPGNLAYIMYTSGSTGRPKGVMVEQIGMINHIYAKISDLQLGKEDVVAQNGPPGFDIVVWQCLAALLVGGRVHIFTDDVADNPARLLDCIEKEKITILQCVPSILRAIIQQAHAAGSNRPALAALRWLVPTGDALVPELCRRWLELYPTIPLLNTYGSTECSDDQCHYALQESPDLDYPLPIVPIGYPVQNMQAYVLDRWLQPVPVGVIGDLYIGGTGVGRGYLDDPARTAEFFLPHPFSAEPGARLYRTRDRTRYLPDGSLQFLSRSDHLIKVHGVRIEPGEIETVLARHPSVEEALVLARAATDGSKRLVAYIASSEKQAAFSDELRAFLRQELPEAMIPGQFVVLAAFPLNSNGKVDRQALPLPEQQRESRRAPYETFRTEMEHTITDIWQAILQQEHIGMRDNFFDLGGNSLHMAQVYNRLREDLQRDLSILDLFKYPTIATLAEYLQQGSTERQYVHVQDRARKQKEAMRRRKREISLE